MPSKDPFSEKEIEKMLEESRIKDVPPDVLKGFKDDVMRRIQAEHGGGPRPAAPKPGSWIAAAFRLPRAGMTVGAGALACLIIASIAALTVGKPAPLPDTAPSVQGAAVRSSTSGGGISEGAFEVASLPAAGAYTTALPQQAAAFGAMDAASRQVRASVKPAALTVEEELRLIEEFDDQRFFIRQDITLDDLASA